MAAYHVVMAGLIARLMGRREEPVPPSDPDRSGEGDGWNSAEAQVRRELDTLQVAYALRTISRERYEDRRRSILARLGGAADPE